MEQSMAHHRDPNAPRHLNAAGFAAFEADEEIIALNKEIAKLTNQIGGQPDFHKDLAKVRTGLYSKKAKRLEAKRAEFVTQWWNVSYDNYIAGKDITERDMMCLFDIHKKYMPERSRIQKTLFKEVSLDSEEGRQCLYDMVSLCTSTEKVAYYPGLSPVNGLCPICEAPMSRYFPDAL